MTRRGLLAALCVLAAVILLAWDEWTDGTVWFDENGDPIRWVPLDTGRPA